MQAETKPGGIIRSYGPTMITVGLISGMINILYLTGSFYMLQVYDRVLPGHSIPTLIGLSGLAALLFAFQGALDILRGRVLTRVGVAFEESLRRQVVDLILRLPLFARSQGDGLQPLRDLDTIRGFLAGLGPVALLDLPWMPLYLAICFIFHPLIGCVAVVGGVTLLTITFLTDRFTRPAVKDAADLAAVRNGLAEAGRRNAEILQAMGIRQRFIETWAEIDQRFQKAQLRGGDTTGGFGAVSKVFRMGLQSAILGTGAYLVLQQEATAGIMIASSILAARALAPVELAIAHWRGFVAARQSWQRLSGLLPRLAEQARPTALPRPDKRFSAEGVAVVPPGGDRLILNDISFEVRAGDGLGIIGPSGSGKSSLARLLVGAWGPARGTVRLDGAALDQWDPADRGRDIGYLPQDVELLAGTVAQNISRFDAEPDEMAIIAAATAADVHELILRLPNGYDTDIGEDGSRLSAGQRQRIALARALYRNPFVVILDEPNSNLDSEGERALIAAIAAVRKRGGIVIIITHRISVLASVDLLLTVADGRMHLFGPRNEVLAKLGQPAPAPKGEPLQAAAPNLRLLRETGGSS